MTEHEEPADITLQYSDRPIEIGLSYPKDILLFGVSPKPARVTHEALRLQFIKWLRGSDVDEFLVDICAATKLTVNVLTNDDVDEFYQIIETGDLPEEDQARAFRAEMVFQLLAEGREDLSFFAPFWTVFLAGNAYASSLDAILVEPFQSRAYKAAEEFWMYQCEAVPLTHQFLSVRGFLDDALNRYSMRSSGMKRFSLPELCIENVPVQYGQEAAYLVRGVAQYIWNAIDLQIPGKSLLQLESEFDLSTHFCEIDRSLVLGIKGALIPIALCWSETENSSESLTIMPTAEFAQDDDWFSLVVQALRDQKTRIREQSGQ